MTQQEIIEQLRKELNELRERVAVLERKPLQWPQQPLSPVPNTTPWPRPKPPFDITCGDTPK
ncbi:MAG: hypothetical protein ACOYNV_27925 [Propionivibrio sp.]